MRLKKILGLVIALSAFGAGAEGAAATTFCVPGFHAACPNNGTNVAKADLEEAMGSNATDGNADQVIAAAGTFTENGTYEPEPGTDSETFEPKGSDPLTVVGAGPGATILTTPATGNVFIVNLNHNNSRAITMRDLTVRIPASVPDGLGGAFQLDGDVLDNVDIVSRNPDSDGIASTIGPGNVFRNGETRGESGGSVSRAMCACAIVGGSLLVEDSILVDASRPLQARDPATQLIARRVRTVDTTLYGAVASAGSVSIENSVFGLADGVGLRVESGANDSSLMASHVTIVDSGSSEPAMQIQKSSGAGKASLAVSNSILRGFDSGYQVNAAAGPGIGTGTLTVRYSNFEGTGTSTGILDVATGNIDTDPQLLPDFSLKPASPSVDAGDPGPGLSADFLGAPRPVDGNGDGVARRDQGAFEYQPPIVDQLPGGDPLPGGGGRTAGGTANPPASDVTAPETTIGKGVGGNLAKGKAKFGFKSSEAGSRFECKLDGRKAASCKSPKRYAGLEPGRHVFKVWAIDAVGNKDPTAAKRRFRVPAAA